MRVQQKLFGSYCAHRLTLVDGVDEFRNERAGLKQKYVKMEIRRGVRLLNMRKILTDLYTANNFYLSVYLFYCLSVLKNVQRGKNMLIISIHNRFSPHLITTTPGCEL